MESYEFERRDYSSSSFPWGITKDPSAKIVGRTSFAEGFV
jgi:hypothetical protein